MGYKILESKEELSLDLIHALTTSVGWGNYYESQEKWQRILDMSNYIAYIKENDRIIAFGRVLEDGMMCMFYDICVHREYQGRGIGSLIMNHLIEKIKNNHYYSIGLFIEDDNPTATEFYKRFGFKTVEGMELKKYMIE